MNQLDEFRMAIDEFMGNHPQSPLDEDQRKKFQGLSYFHHNDALELEIDVERIPDSEPLIDMETSTGAVRQYRRWGRIKFVLDGTESSMVIYSDALGHEFFLPFRDGTSGKESYGAGRYLDSHRPGLERLSEARFRVDFNYAYNPYCAYSPYLSCPLPPRENWVSVPITAGEKHYK
jgi:uncharacterized protein (DUF1684 family)